VSDSTALGDTDVEPPHEQHQVWLPKSTETLDAQTVVPQTTAFSQVPHHSNLYPSGVGLPLIQQPQARHGTFPKFLVC